MRQIRKHGFMPLEVLAKEPRLGVESKTPPRFSVWVAGRLAVLIATEDA